MPTVDFNSDLGESFGHYTIGLDREILTAVSSANIATGFHAGDPVVMAETVALAQENGVAIGAHPGFPDLQGFGRRRLAMAPAEIKDMVKYQMGALMAFVPSHRLHHVKPHGALYNWAAQDANVAEAIVAAVQEVDEQTILYGLANSELIKAAMKYQQPYAQEVFADRAYQADGNLVSRKQAGAVITDPHEAADRALKMVEDHQVVAITGETIPLAVDSICVHGDTQSAVDLARLIRQTLTNNGVTISSKIGG
ncbi:5-oxoprolinase subunit PxpA [Leuconostocaceae bacterium ESL0723]|nr:5-oxoprolinase subunit PxpA [Leuconostocaceae bacterium ESL0723]